MTDLLTAILAVLGAGAGAAVVLAAFARWISRHFRRHDEAHLQVDTGIALLLSDLVVRNKDLSIPARELIGQISAREDRVKTKVEAWEKAVAGGNPLTPAEIARRQELDRRMQQHGETLSVAELQDLLQLLNRELDDARATGAAVAVIIGIILLIALVVAALAIASR